MAKFNSQFGIMTGKLGNFVLSSRKGEVIARAYNPVVENPRTARQQLSRAKLSLASDLARSLAGALRIGYGQYAKGLVSARNVFVKDIVPVGAQTITGTTPAALQINWERVKVSDGNFGYPGCDEPDLENPLRIQVGISEPNLTPDVITDASGTPVVVTANLVAYNKTLKTSTVLSEVFYDPSNPQLQPPADLKMDVPSNWQGTQVEMYIFYKQHPVAVNGIANTTAPQRYPGAAGITSYLGSGTIA